MNKTLLIINREYFSRVKKKSFLLMTFLVPLLIIGMYALVFALSMNGGDNIPTVQVIDESGAFGKGLKDKKSVKFQLSSESLETAKQRVIKNEDIFILHIPKDIETGGKLELFGQKKTGLSVGGSADRGCSF